MAVPTVDAITVTPGNIATPGALTGTLPSGSGDLLVAFVMFDNVLVTATGWTVQDSRIVGGTADVGVTLLTAPSDVASLVFTPTDTARNGVLTIYRISGAGGVNGVTGTGALGNTTSTTRAIPTLVTTVDDCLLISGIGRDADTDTAYTWPAGWTEQSAEGVVGDLGLRSSTAISSQATAGTTTGGNVTSVSDHHAISVIALEPGGADPSEGSATGTFTWVGSATGSHKPATPTGLEATAISNTEIDLTWDAVTGASGYDIERDGTVIATDHSSTTYNDTGLTLNTEYEYRVRAVE